MNQIKNNQFEYDLETQREYAISSGQLDSELKEEEENNILVSGPAEMTQQQQKQQNVESPIVKVLCSKCGIGVYVRQNMINEEQSQYCAFCSNLEEETSA